MSDDPTLNVPRGFRASGGPAGIKPSGGPDLAVFLTDGPTAAAGTFTTNRVAAAPVHWDRARVPSKGVRAIVVNAGNANAATGAQGLADAGRTAAIAAARIGCRPDDVLVASTGVIGHPLPMDRFEKHLPAAIAATTADPSGWHDASRAILTTDSRPKVVSERCQIGGEPVTLLGMAKGAAMIGPRMATMLGFLFTDATIDPNDLQSILSEAVEGTFNCISVEGHTSTNDTVLALAGGAEAQRLRGSGLSEFAGVTRRCCERLARMIPEDGEGATHLITIDVQGCHDREQARTLARSVADSPLVKTAVHGADPNWGRIVSAAGYAGVPFRENEVDLWLNGVPLYRDGAPLPFDAAAVSARLRGTHEVMIRLVFRLGDASIRFWTCDLTADYVRLNADYTT